MKDIQGVSILRLPSQSEYYFFPPEKCYSIQKCSKVMCQMTKEVFTRKRQPIQTFNVMYIINCLIFFQYTLYIRGCFSIFWAHGYMWTMGNYSGYNSQNSYHNVLFILAIQLFLKARYWFQMNMYFQEFVMRLLEGTFLSYSAIINCFASSVFRRTRRIQRVDKARPFSLLTQLRPPGQAFWGQV